MKARNKDVIVFEMAFGASLELVTLYKIEDIKILDRYNITCIYIYIYLLNESYQLTAEGI
jgi:hypothetical protein